MKNTLKTESVIAANRFGLGARPGDLKAINKDPKAWLLAQLPGPARPAAVIAALGDSASLLVEVEKARDLRRMNKQKAESGDKGPGSYARTVRKFYMQQTAARYVSAATTDYPFHERLVHFWSNHFAVSADKQPIAAIAGSFENEAIRPNIAGKF